MSSIQKIQRQSGRRYKAVLKSGSRVLKTKTFTKEALAKQWLKRMQMDAEAMDALGLKGARMTLNELVVAYKAQYQGCDASIKGKLAHWCAALGEHYLVDITTQRVREHLAQYKEGAALRPNGSRNKDSHKLINTGKARKPATVNRMRSALSALFKYANQQGWVNQNPVRNIPALPENNKRIRYLSQEELKRLLTAAKASEWNKLYLLILMAICTGARKSEMLNLKWEDINFERREALVRKTKNGEPRVLTLPPPVIKALTPYRGVGLIFPSPNKPFQPIEFKKYWQHILIQANLSYEVSHEKHLRFHDLIHTAASYLVMNGATLYETGEVLGHKCLETTKRYAHLNTDHKRRLTDRVFGEIDETGLVQLEI